MSEEEILCMECSATIKNTKEIESISYMTPLSRDEKTSEIKNIIETQNLEDIHSNICINCLHECIKEMKEKLNEEEKKHEDCLISLEDLLLDISNKKEINKIIDNLLNDKEIKDLRKQFEQLCEKSEELENIIKNDKDDLRNLKDEEQKLYIKLNENNRKKKDKEIYLKTLKKKKEFLEKLFEELEEGE